jgi:hypothetical protein
MAFRISSADAFFKSVSSSQSFRIPCILQQKINAFSISGWLAFKHKLVQTLVFVGVQIKAVNAGN